MGPGGVEPSPESLLCLSCPLLLLPAKLLFSSSFLIFLLMDPSGEGIHGRHLGAHAGREGHSRDGWLGRGQGRLVLGRWLLLPLTLPHPCCLPLMAHAGPHQPLGVFVKLSVHMTPVHPHNIGAPSTRPESPLKVQALLCPSPPLLSDLFHLPGKFFLAFSLLHSVAFRLPSGLLSAFRLSTWLSSSSLCLSSLAWSTFHAQCRD